MRYATCLLFVVFCISCQWLSAADKSSKYGNEAVLQAKIGLTPERVLPGTRVEIKAKIKNTGRTASRPAKVQVRFALPKPLHKDPKSILFETEIVSLPSIEPGQEKLVVFDTEHQLPAVADFIRYDWPMRQYQVVLLDGEKEFILGTLSITLSAYYYEGPAKSVQVALP